FVIRDEVYGYFRDRQRMIRTQRWKLIEYPRIERLQLFDLQVDPRETNDLSRDFSHLETVNQMRTQLHVWLAEQAGP
ncbi:MAG: sulfatase/phosphatase domain-containing protein, partial [Pirellulaceae bacterium]